MFLNALLSFHQLHHTGLSGEESCFSDYRHLPSLSFHLFRQSPRCLRDQEPTPMIRLDITLSFAAHLFPSVFILCCYFWGQLLNNKQLHLVRIEVSCWNEWPLSNYLKCRLEYFWDLKTDIQTFTQDTHVDQSWNSDWPELGLPVLSCQPGSYDLTNTIWLIHSNNHRAFGSRNDFQISMSVLELELNQISTIPVFPPITQPCLQGKVVTM